MDFAERYKTPLADIFTRSHKLHLEWKVELALLKALGTTNIIPAEAYSHIKAVIDGGQVTLARTLEIEQSTHHDIMAMVKAISEQSAEYGGYVHYGATSQDINDTVIALQLTQAKEMLLNAVRACRAQLTRLAKQYRSLVTIARTHGQHAIPITMGFKFANFLYELSVAELHLARVHIPGKFGGAAGTFASLGTQQVQTLIMHELGLTAVPISTQVISRLHIADFIYGCASIAAVLERLGKEIRNLQRTEINETMEGFGADQVGSSTMPQKRNPHKSERVCGLARDIRSALQPAMETISMEHERDLTNSSVERSVIPRAAIFTHYILLEMEKILQLLAVDESRVEYNLNLLGGKQLSERIMMACTHKLGRQTAHEILRQYATSTQFVRDIKADHRISSVMSELELNELLDPHTYIGLAPQIVDQIVQQYGVGDCTTTTSASSASVQQRVTPLTYAAAGVDIDAGDNLVEHIKPLAASTRRPGADADLGGFGGLFDLSVLGMHDPLIVACTDGVGTKLSLAHIAQKHDTIGIDLVAMSVNDLIVQGAQPLLFLDYYATSALNVAEAKQVIAGIAAGCRESQCALIGGETAELPGMYQPGDYDLAGFAVGAVERTAVLPRLSQICVGDVVLGISSAGVHSNGYSLVRRVVKESGVDWLAAPPYKSTHPRLVDDLLTPTRLYVRSVLAAAATGHVKALAHITGGGLPDNIPRVLPSNLVAELDATHWTVPPVFHWLSGIGRPGAPVETAEMLRTYNMGIGMIVVVDAQHALDVQQLLEQYGERVWNVGRLIPRKGQEPQVAILQQEQLFARKY